MPKNLSKPIFYCIVVAIFCLPQFTKAQLSEGGTPPGFKFTNQRSIPVKVMPRFNVDSMLMEDEENAPYKDRPYRFGYNHMVNYGLSNSGTWSTLPDGSRLWQLGIRSTGAYTLNFGFSHFHLPEGAKLFIYTPDHEQIIGAITAKQNTPDYFLGSDLVNDDEAIIEYYEPANVKGEGNFILFRITHGYADLGSHMKSFGAAAVCINNVNCPQYANFFDQKRSVVCVVKNGNEACSGALVNNTSNSGTPYVLTANHCGTPDGTWLFRFNWEAPGCTNPASNPPSQSISGGTSVASSGVSDFDLVLMNSAPPLYYKVFYAGWSRSATPATSVTCIHHPGGDIKKCSQAANPVGPSVQDLGHGPAQVWQIGEWTDGVTQGGSSGSPLFDQNKRIIGQLYGGPSFCGANNSSLTDYYGRFNISWDSNSTASARLKDWLDSANTGAMFNDGWDPNHILYTLDAGLSKLIEPTSVTCNTSLSPIVQLKSQTNGPLNSATINYQIDNGTVNTYAWTGFLDTFQTTDVVLPAINVGVGTHYFIAWVSNPNNGTDQNVYDDTVQAAFTTIAASPMPLPFFEGFEDNSFPPANWVLTTPASGTTWAQSNVGSFGLSAHCASVDEFSPGSSTVGERPELITPNIDLSNTTAPLVISFDLAYAPYSITVGDTLIIWFTINCGENWNIMYVKGGVELSTGPDTTQLFVPLSSQWRTDSIDLTGLLGTAHIQFKFQLRSEWGNKLYLDNVNIHDSLHRTNNITLLSNGLNISYYPNPLSSTGNIRLELQESTDVNVELFSAEGKKVLQVFNGNLQPGLHTLQFDGSTLSNGLYFLRVNDRYLKMEKM